MTCARRSAPAWAMPRWSMPPPSWRRSTPSIAWRTRRGSRSKTRGRRRPPTSAPRSASISSRKRVARSPTRATAPILRAGNAELVGLDMRCSDQRRVDGDFGSHQRIQIGRLHIHRINAKLGEFVAQARVLQNFARGVVELLYDLDRRPGARKNCDLEGVL